MSAGATMVAVLGALATIGVLGEILPVPGQVGVLVVVLSLMLCRSVERGVHLGLEAAVEVVAVSLAATGVAWLLLNEPGFGEVLLVVGLSVGILARRWQGVVRRAGQVIALPFLALLVTPVVVSMGAVSTPGLFIWSAFGAVVAVAWTTAIAHVAWHPEESTPAPQTRPSRRRIDAPTRMALQMLVGLGVAMVVGRLLFDDRWAWCVLSAFIVAAGNRGRGDVAHKATLRIIGALIGTVVATLAVLHVAPGHRSTLVELFLVMAVALVLRSRSYAFWAAGMTAMVSLLHAYYGNFGQTGAEQLRERLLGVVVGAAIGLAAAWFVLPVRTRDVFRSRLAVALAALTDNDGTFPAALSSLDQLTPTLRASARYHDGARRQLAAVRALHDLPRPGDDDSRRALRSDIIRIRRSMIGKDDPAPDELLPALRPVHSAVSS